MQHLDGASQSASEHLYLMIDNIHNLNYQQLDYASWFRSYSWECFISIRIPPHVPLNMAHTLLINDVLRPIALYLHTQIAAVTVISPGHGMQKPHMHTLVISKRSRISDNIPTIIEHLRSRESTLARHQDAVNIKPYGANPPIDHPGYLAGHIMGKEDIFYHNRRLIAANKMEA